MDFAEMSIRLDSRFKGQDERRIREKVAAIYGRHTDTAESVKDWVCEDDGDEIDPTSFSETRSPPAGMAKAVSKL
jgi:hypothetical protein